jgi:SOS-response transcriptional repressor LexA
MLAVLPSRMDVGDVLRELRNRAGMSIREVSKSLRVSHGLIQQKEVGTVKIKPQELEEWAALLGSSADVVLSKANKKQARMVPLLTEVQAGRLIRSAEDVGWTLQDADRFVETTATVAVDAFAVEVQGDSMAPRIRPGDICICEMLKEGDENRLTDGRLVVAWISPAPAKSGGSWMGGPVIGRWTSRGDGMIELRKDNPEKQAVVVPATYERVPRIAVVVELKSLNP